MASAGTTGAGPVIFIDRSGNGVLVHATPHVDDLILSLYHEGLTVTRIAELCDRSHRFVHRRPGALRDRLPWRGEADMLFH